MIQLYAITDRPGSALPRGSLEEATAHGVAAVFTRAGRHDVDPTPDALWAHDEVVEALMRDRAVLPMRFGACLPDEAALAGLLDRRGLEFARLLDGVRDRVELGVRVTGRSAPPAQAASGSEYMQQRLDARREAQRIAQAVHAPLAQLAERSTSDLAPARGGVLTGSYLLREDGIQSFTERVRRLQETHSSLTLTCTGPWPPYSFVEEQR